MLKKLKSKALVDYEKYGKLSLTEGGKAIAVRLIRKHRLWETFLFKYLNFSWDEVHEVAEQLEHIRSPKLMAELDRFMGFPQTDPHGEAIPNEFGEFDLKPKIALAALKTGDICRLVSVSDDSIAFLRYVSKIGLALNIIIEIGETRAFDRSMEIRVEGITHSVSCKFAEHIFVEILHEE
jgi:DtxR family Mn-dependent transcriptional regulator